MKNVRSKEDTGQEVINQHTPTLDQQTTSQYEIIPDTMRGSQLKES